MLHLQPQKLPPQLYTHSTQGANRTHLTSLHHITNIPRLAAVDRRARDLVRGEVVAPDVDQNTRVVGAIGAGEGDALGVRGAATGDGDLLCVGTVSYAVSAKLREWERELT